MDWSKKELVETDRPEGMNDIGMLAWRFLGETPRQSSPLRHVDVVVLVVVSSVRKVVKVVDGCFVNYPCRCPCRCCPGSCRGRDGGRGGSW